MYFNNESPVHATSYDAASARRQTGLRGDPDDAAQMEALRGENINLRMRLMYYDELLSKQNCDVSLANDLVDARMETNEIRKLVEGIELEVQSLKVENQRLRAEKELLCAKQQTEVAAEMSTLKMNNAVLTQRVAQLEAALESTSAAHENQVHALQLEHGTLDATSERQIAELSSALDRRTDEVRGLQEEAESLRSRCQHLEGEVERRERAVGELRDDAALRQHEHAASLKEWEDKEKALGAELEQLKRRAERQLQDTAGKEQSAISTEEVLKVYKRMFQVLVEGVRRVAKAPPVSEWSTVMGGTLVLQDPSTSRMPVDLSPIREERAPQSPAAMAAQGTLSTAIDDCLLYVQYEISRRGTSTVDSLRRIANDSLLALEDTYGTVATRVRRHSNRLTMIVDNVQFLMKRKAKDWRSSAEKVQVLQRNLQATEAQRQQNERELDAARNENLALRSEVQRLNASRISDVMEKTALALVECRKALEARVTDAVKDIRTYFFNTNVITPDLVDQMKRVITRVAEQVHEIHDLIEAARAGSVAASPSNDASARRSPSAVSPSSQSVASVRQHTIEQLVNQTANFCVLLDNNLHQSKVAAEQIEQILVQWERQIITELRSFEARISPSTPSQKISGDKKTGARASLDATF